MNFQEQIKQVKLAAPKMAANAEENRNKALLAVSEALLAHQDEIFAANKADMEQAEKDGVSGPVLKRLKFDVVLTVAPISMVLTVVSVSTFVLTSTSSV